MLDQVPGPEGSGGKYRVGSGSGTINSNMDQLKKADAWRKVALVTGCCEVLIV